VRLAKYLKTAFLNQWNLLAFLGAAAFGVISGAPDIVLPLVAAGEMTYLGLLATHPKFQKYVDAQDAKATRTDASVAAQRALDRITQSLPRDSLDRFRAIKARCLELQQIALELKHPGKLPEQLPFEDFQADSLDRLLWIHLRLLYTEYALQRFLSKTSERQMREDIGGVEERLARIPADTQSPQQQRIRKALQDNLQTLNDRLANLQKARDNYELVKLEIERLENKIQSLSELAVNRQEPDYISGQVDQVAASMLETEKTMNELQFATGLETVEATPELLRDRAVQVH
jgi:chemotaxis protein histidine kinase CheA